MNANQEPIHTNEDVLEYVQDYIQLSHNLSFHNTKEINHMSIGKEWGEKNLVLEIPINKEFQKINLKTGVLEKYVFQVILYSLKTERERERKKNKINVPLVEYWNKEKNSRNFR